MSTDNSKNKNIIFEYFVFQLEQWSRERNVVCDLTKLRLQKILFFAVTINSTQESHPLLDIFDRFFAMPYGPVELDIYESMKKDEFENISFNGIHCKTDFVNFAPLTIDAQIRQYIDDAVGALKNVGFDYLSSPVYTLVEITHKWSAWRIAMDVSEITGGRQERMTTDNICNSAVKAYS